MKRGSKEVQRVKHHIGGTECDMAFLSVIFKVFKQWYLRGNLYDEKSLSLKIEQLAIKYHMVAQNRVENQVCQVH